MRYREANKLKVKDEVQVLNTGEVLNVLDIKISSADVYVYLDTFYGTSWVHHREIKKVGVV